MNPQKNPWSKATTNNKLNPHTTSGRNETQVTLVGGKCSHHCTTPAPTVCLLPCFRGGGEVQSSWGNSLYGLNRSMSASKGFLAFFGHKWLLLLAIRVNRI